MSAYGGLMVKAEDDGNKLLRQDNFWLAIKFGSTVKQPIPMEYGVIDSSASSL
jgi:hypothetical protein